jgi:hypothetical protein
MLQENFLWLRSENKFVCSCRYFELNLIGMDLKINLNPAVSNPMKFVDLTFQLHLLPCFNFFAYKSLHSSSD